MIIEFQGYSSKELLYESRTSIVYRGYRNKDNLPVVLKLLKGSHPNNRELTRYRREYDLLKHLTDAEHIINVHALEVQGNSLFLVLEDFGAESLKSLLNKHPFSLAELLSLFKTVADTLALLHQQHFVHKDINPSNIVYNPKTSQCKLIDFGSAKQLTLSQTNHHQDHLQEGTLAYISPEQSGRTGLNVDYRSDLYSLGVSLYEMFSGQLPFSTQNDLKMVHAHIAVPETPLYKLIPDIPRTISDIVSKLMQKSSEERYQTAKGLLTDLDLCAQALQKGTIETFPLGRYDYSDTFYLPQKLYGRGKEIARLQEIFVQQVITQKETAFLLISGYSGTGKSSLVNEIKKNVSLHQGHFVSGKFDQVYRNIPYYAFKQALAGLVDIWLVYDEKALERLKERLHDDLGDSGAVLLEVIPTLELIIGPQKPLTPLAGAEAQNRFNFACRRFFRSAASTDFPLIFFLDDLQWADLASLNLLSNLLNDIQLGNLLVIGAYRNNETFPTHPLILMLDSLRQQGISIHSIEVGNLSETMIVELCADVLHALSETVQPLAHLIHTKTLGNPFFVTQFLKSLYDDGLIVFNNGAWQWDIKQIEQRDIPSDVVQLMAAKISTLSLATQRLLTLAACIGNRFDLHTLAVVSNLNENETTMNLTKALEEGLLIMYDQNCYRFSHDRIQQAAYSLMNDHERMHLLIARLLLAKGEPEGETLFQVVNHFNNAIALIHDPEERLILARLNLAAGRTAKQGTAYSSAINYLSTAIGLLNESSWSEHYALTFDIHSEMAWCQFFAGEDEGISTLFETLEEHAVNRDDRIAVHTIRMEYYHLLGEYQKAIEIQKEVLRLLGVEVDEEAISTLLQGELDKVNQLLGNRRIEELSEAAELTSTHQMAILDVLMRLWTSAYLASRAELVAWSSCKMTTISLDQGNSYLSSFAYMNYAFVCVALLEQYETGHRFGRVAITLSERYDVPLLRGKVYLLFAVFINHWREPLASSLEYSLKSLPLLVENGDWTYAGYCAEFIISDPTIWGMSCDKILEEAERYLPFLKNSTPVILQEFVLPACLNPVLQLKGKTRNDHTFNNQQFNEKSFLDAFGNNPLALSYYQTAKLRSLYWFGYWDEALEMIGSADFVASVALAQAKVPEVYFYASLTILALHDELDAKQQEKLLAKVTQYQEKMRLWADNSPANFKHKYLLVEAERARIANSNWKALTYYEAAIKDAMTNGYINNAALAYECTSRFLKSRNMGYSAAQFLGDAIYTYERWGATAKAKQLEKEYLELSNGLLQKNLHSFCHKGLSNISETYHTTTTSHLDLISIIQASQSLASEINLEKLLEQMIVIAKENAGADRCLLLIPDNGKWKIIAQTFSESNIVSISKESESYADEKHIPITLLNYCARIKKSQVLDHASMEGRFFSDPYFAHTKIKSALSVPLVQSGILQGMLYLENRLVKEAFNLDRSKVLELLSSQMAISIVNAKFYRSLENEVAERTSELVNVNAALKKANDRLEELSYVDSLTQLANRRMLDDFLAKEWKRHQRTNETLSIILCDIDYFKQFNDIYGHLQGDDCLKQVAQTLKQALQRPGDLVARYGGEEFTVILPETGMEGTKQIVTRIQKNIQQLGIPHENSKVSNFLTLSFGTITTNPSKDDKLNDVLQAADRALYDAKTQGRNRAVFLNTKLNFRT